jgi:hypothetical protein
MFGKLHLSYMRPRVLKVSAVLLEQDLLAGSIVDSLNAEGVNATPQEVENKDFESGAFNFKWE